MRSCSISALSIGWSVRSGPAWHRSVGSALGLCAGICGTTKTDAGKWADNACTSVLSASTPPAEAPITIISCPDKASSREDDYLYYRMLRVFANFRRIQSTLQYQRGCVRAFKLVESVSFCWSTDIPPSHALV